MLSHNTILTIIKDSTPQQPMPKAQLLLKSGFSEPALNTALIEMYALGKINQCKHTKHNVTDDVYWPTGVCKIVADYGRNGTPTPPRRDLSIKKQEPTMPDDQTSGQASKKFNETADNRPKALKVIAYIEEHPDCSFVEISKGTGVDFPLAYIKTSIHRGKIIATKHPNFKCTYKLADGCTAESIYIKKGQKHVKEATPVAVREVFDIPAFLRKPADEFAVADSVDEKLGDQYTGPQKITAEEWIADEAEMQRTADEKKISEHNINFDDFKIALTTNKTLMLFGIHYQPIELNHQQTRTLSDFLSELDVAAYLI